MRHPELNDGIICGRFKISASHKHPYVIDHRLPFARLIVGHYHRKHLHAGQQLLIAAMRERFWITSVRNPVRSVLHDCVPCFRERPQVYEQLMADLPIFPFCVLELTTADRFQSCTHNVVRRFDRCAYFVLNYKAVFSVVY